MNLKLMAYARNPTWVTLYTDGSNQDARTKVYTHNDGSNSAGRLGVTNSMADETDKDKSFLDVEEFRQII